MNLIAWATGLAPYAGIAFLWFLGVIRDRLGKLEDQFFSTVFFGSGLLFVAMMFTSSALTSSTNSTIQFIHNSTEGVAAGQVLLFARVAMYQTMNVYAIKMAGVFMMSLSTIWLRTGVMPVSSRLRNTWSCAYLDHCHQPKPVDGASLSHMGVGHKPLYPAA